MTVVGLSVCINIKLMFTQISQRPAPEGSSSFSVSCNNIFFIIVTLKL